MFEAPAPPVAAAKAPASGEQRPRAVPLAVFTVFACLASAPRLGQHRG